MDISKRIYSKRECSCRLNLKDWTKEIMTNDIYKSSKSKRYLLMMKNNSNKEVIMNFILTKIRKKRKMI